MKLKRQIKESLSEKEILVAEIIAKLKELPSEGFYPALLIYDVLGIEHPSEELINAVDDLQESFESVYDEFLRDTIKEEAELIDKIEVREIPVSKKEEPEIAEELKCGHTKGKLGHREEK